MATPKIIAEAKSAGKTNKTKNSLVKCEVKIPTGEWISPESCQVFYIDEDAKFPEITYEIKTDYPGPYEWDWSISWNAQACPQADEKNRYKAKKEAIFLKFGKFKSDEKTWKADLGEIIGGDLIVKVKAGGVTFIRKTLIRGTNPSKEKIIAEVDAYPKKEDGELLKKIFTQESRYRQFYSDDLPLTSFDNGYGLGQLTNPTPTYEQIWDWKAHVAEIILKRLPWHRKRAKKHLDSHGSHTEEMLNLETLASYNGWAGNQRYWTWSEAKKMWEINGNVVCDSSQSNKGWVLTEESNKGKTLDQLKSGKDNKPTYTGRCYAEHIKNAQK